jgi:hypothetical protein
MANNAGLNMKEWSKTPCMCNKLLRLNMLFISFPVPESYPDETAFTIVTDKTIPRS